MSTRKKRTIRTGLLSGAVLAALVVMAGCGSNAALPAPAPSSTTPTSSTSAPPASTTASAKPTPTSTSSTSVPPAQTDVISVVTDGGYQANVTIEWYAYTTISSTEVLPACDPSWNTDSSLDAAGYVAAALADPKNYVFHAVTATLSTEFPVVNGFTWLSGDSISVDAIGNGGTTGALYCFTREIKDTGFTINLSTAKSTVTTMWVWAVQKSPNNPTGRLPATVQSDFELSVSGPGNCTSTATQTGPHRQGTTDKYVTCTSNFKSDPTHP